MSRAFKAGKCQEAKIKDKKIMMRGQRIKSDDILFCKFCDVNFDTLMNYNKHVQLHGKPGSGFFLQPRDQKILQDVADKPEVRPHTKFERNRSTPTGTQSDDCAGRKLEPSTNNGANGDAVVENKKASRSC